MRSDKSYVPDAWQLMGLHTKTALWVISIAVEYKINHMMTRSFDKLYTGDNQPCFLSKP